jgi:hypothetical protein
MLQNANTTPLCGVGPGTGSIVLTYSSQDFVLSATSSGGSVAYGQDPGMNPPVFDRGGVAIFPYSGDFFCHGDQSDSFTFTPQNATNTALVTATIIVDGSGGVRDLPGRDHPRAARPVVSKTLARAGGGSGGGPARISRRRKRLGPVLKDSWRWPVHS